MLKQVTDINAKDEEHGITALHLAVRARQKKIIELLISKGADINAKDDLFGYTPFHWTVLAGCKDLIVLLLSEGSDINAKTEKVFNKIPKGSTPLDIAEILKSKGSKRGKDLNQAEDFPAAHTLAK